MISAVAVANASLDSSDRFVCRSSMGFAVDFFMLSRSSVEALSCRSCCIVFLRSSRSASFALSLICFSSFLICLSISWHFCAIFYTSVTTPRAVGLLWLQYHLIASLSDRKLYAAFFWHLPWSHRPHMLHFNPCSLSRTGSEQSLQGIVSVSSARFVGPFCLVFLSATLPLRLLLRFWDMIVLLDSPCLDTPSLEISPLLFVG